MIWWWLPDCLSMSFRTLLSSKELLLPHKLQESRKALKTSRGKGHLHFNSSVIASYLDSNAICVVFKIGAVIWSGSDIIIMHISKRLSASSLDFVCFEVLREWNDDTKNLKNFFSSVTVMLPFEREQEKSV